MLFDSREWLDYRDVLILPKRSDISSRSEVDLIRDFTFKYTSLKWSGFPLMVANMSTTGVIPVALALKEEKMITCLHKFHTVEDLRPLEGTNYGDYISLSTGIKENDYERVKQILKEYPEIKFLTIDVANGYMVKFADFIKRVRDDFQDRLVIIAGNVVTSDAAQELILSGASGVKCGIGPGQSCLTRRYTGVGAAQLSAVIEVSDAVHQLGGFSVADGGCTTEACIAKAFAGNADFVMCGSFFAGSEEASGQVVEKIENDFKYYNPETKQVESHGGTAVKYKEFYGMSSKKANEKFSNLTDYKAYEGRELLIPYTGPVSETIQRIKGGLRSCCAYVGARKIKHLPKHTTFIRVNNQLNTSLEKYET